MSSDVITKLHAELILIVFNLIARCCSDFFYLGDEFAGNILSIVDFIF